MLLPRRFSLRLPRTVVALRQHVLRQMHLATCATASQQVQRQHRKEAHTDAAAEAFFARKANSFASLGLEGSLTRALQAAGFDKPARVQVGRLNTCALLHASAGFSLKMARPWTCLKAPQYGV